MILLANIIFNYGFYKLNTRVLTNEKEKHPLWMTILFSIVLLALVFLVANYSYKKWIGNYNEPINSSELLSEQQLILNQDDVINTNWLRTLDPLVKNVEGRIVWSNVLQKGVMEFIALPKISDDQKYQLWIYDLVGKDTKPVLSHEFNEVNSEKMLIPVASKVLINSPFKFELLLKTEGEENSQPLFLAQP